MGGIVVMRLGENALKTIDRIKDKLIELEAGLPEISLIEFGLR